MRFSKRVIYPLIIATTLSGCGVKPRPVSIEEVADNALTDISQIYASQEPMPKVLTLPEAMARALKYNLDNRVKLMEQAVAHKSVELAELDMLPMLGVAAGYLDRSNVDGSSSQSLITHRQSLEPSTSQDRRRANADIRFTWNILDFGVSYMQARQNADRYLISEKTREKVMLKLLQQVRSAYWRALAMQKLSKDVDAMLKKVDVMLNDLEAVRKIQLYTPLFALRDIRMLVETKKELESIKESITIANVELANLINQPSKTQLTLEVPNNFEKTPVLPQNINEMELTALLNSTDYITEVYNVRINQAESHKALLRLLPGIEFSYAGNYSSNSFLWNSLWGEAGVRLAGDLLKLLTVPDTLEYKEISHNLAVSKRQAVNSAVIAGVHLAWQNYANALKRLDHSTFLSKIDNEIAQLTLNAEENKAGKEVTTIQNEFKAFSSEMARLLAYARAQDAYGAFLVSLGSNPVPEDYQRYSVLDLASLVSGRLQAWENGKLDIKDINKMQKQIAARKKKEEEQSLIDALLEEPIIIDPASIEAEESKDKKPTTVLATDTKVDTATKAAEPVKPPIFIKKQGVTTKIPAAKTPLKTAKAATAKKPVVAVAKVEAAPPASSPAKDEGKTPTAPVQSGTPEKVALLPVAKKETTPATTAKVEFAPLVSTPAKENVATQSASVQPPPVVAPLPAAKKEATPELLKTDTPVNAQPQPAAKVASIPPAKKEATPAVATAKLELAPLPLVSTPAKEEKTTPPPAAQMAAPKAASVPPAKKEVTPAVATAKVELASPVSKPTKEEKIPAAPLPAAKVATVPAAKKETTPAIAAAKIEPAPLPVSKNVPASNTTAPVKSDAKNETTRTLTLIVPDDEALALAKKTDPTFSAMIEGNVLADDIVDNAQIKMTTVTGVDTNGVIRPVIFGVPFITKAGGSLLVKADGSYNYVPPAAGKTPAGGLIETFTYRIKNTNPANASQPLATTSVEQNADTEWLLQQSADKYTFQLMSLTNPEAIDALLEKYKKLKKSLRVVHFSYGDQQDRYVLFYGAFQGMNGAKMALKTLPKEFKQGWIRNVIDVQNQIRNNDIVARKI